ncbi:MAG: TIM44-like domain-containing protein [Fibrobacterota bacterium]|nr:TIM44-like domain-containing protein [Fibrobacterota bacterium]
MASDTSHAMGIIHTENIVPFGLHIKPSHICFALAAIIITALYYRRRFKPKLVIGHGIVTGKRDAAWEEANLKLGTVETFKEVQAAWSKGDLAALSLYVEKKLCREWELRKAEMQMTDARLEISGVTVHEVEIINAKDYLDNVKDEFIARISFNAVDATNRDKEPIRIEEGQVIEFWKMGRFQDRWKVREISRDGILARISLALEPSIQEKGNHRDAD